MPVYSIDGIRPVVHPDSYVHPSAVIIGDVIIAEDCYIAPCAVLRGDFGRLILECGANLQDTCVMHGFPGCETVIEVDGHIGHGAFLHGCHVGKNALVGMNSVVMDGATIGESAFVAAMSFVKAEMQIPARHLAAGTPARIVRELSFEEINWKKTGTQDYQQLARRSMNSMVETTALTKPEKDRRRIEIDSVAPLKQYLKND